MFDSTTTILSTTTVTHTKTLTRTILSVTSFSPASASGLPLSPAHTDSHSSLYFYNPSLPLSVIFTLLYFVTTIYHGYLSIYLPTRPETLNKHRYTIPLFVASLCSTLGYLTRSISIQPHHTSNVPLYTASVGFILIAPIFVCATLYLLLTRLIIRCFPCSSPGTPTTSHNIVDSKNPPSERNPLRFLFVSPTLLGAFFISSDTLTFLIQVIGAAIATSHDLAEPTLTRGIRVLLAGLTLQMITFLLFMLVLHLFCLRVRNSNIAGFNPCIMKVVIATWIAAGFILLRTLFRLVEFAAGSNGYAFRHEWCLYVFEALPVWIALVVLGWWHPVKWVQERVLAGVRSRQSAGVQLQGRGNKVDGVIARKPVGSGDSDASGHVRRRSRPVVGFDR